ncbi:MAG: dihydrolipoyl dehydrogenase family protein [Alkalispirochaetaceae bacterium]
MVDITVIGSGPGGREAAVQAAKRGLTVAVVSATPPGGRATVGSLLPSKVWLAEAERYHEARSLAPDLTPAVEAITAGVNRRMKQRSASVSEELEKLGVAVHLGSGVLLSPQRLRIEPTEEAADAYEIESRYVILATGSEPRFFPNVKPDGQRIIAPRHTRLLQEIPESILFVGGGVTSTEYASVFAKLGSRVTIATNIERLLPRSDVDLVASVTDYLTSLGVEIMRNTPIASVEREGERVVTRSQGGEVIETDYAFIATGRLPDHAAFADLGLETNENGALLTDAQQRTSISTVFAVGDVTGAPMIANRAIRQGRVAAAAIVGDPEGDIVSAGLNIEAVYTHPGLAQVGPVQELREKEGAGVTCYRRGYGEALGPLIEDHGDGYIKIWEDDTSGEVLGGAAFGEHAVELMAPVQIAAERGMSLKELLRSPFAHPSMMEILSIG